MHRNFSSPPPPPVPGGRSIAALHCRVLPRGRLPAAATGDAVDEQRGLLRGLTLPRPRATQPPKPKTQPSPSAPAANVCTLASAASRSHTNSAQTPQACCRGHSHLLRSHLPLPMGGLLPLSCNLRCQSMWACGRQESACLCPMPRRSTNCHQFLSSSNASPEVQVNPFL